MVNRPRRKLQQEFREAGRRHCRSMEACPKSFSLPQLHFGHFSSPLKGCLHIHEAGPPEADRLLDPYDRLGFVVSFRCESQLDESRWFHFCRLMFAPPGGNHSPQR
jgi:hypothetical protein